MAYQKKKNIRYKFILQCYSSIILLISTNIFAQDLATKNDAVVSYLKTNFSQKITNVIVNKNDIIIQGNISGRQSNLYLCELRMFNDTRLVSNSFASVTSINTSNQNFKIQLQRIAGNNSTYDRLFSRWIIASKKGQNYQQQSFAHYADDIRNTASQYLPEEKPTGKKGLEGFFQESRESDLADLGLSNVTVNITLPQVISLAPTQYAYKFDGKTYYMNAKTVEHYDREFKLCSDKNVFVTAIILIQQNNIPQNIKSLLVHADANGGVESMANLTSQQGFDYFAALIGFLAERYNRPDRQYGRIQNWIVHNEVDNGIYWTNAGNARLESYTEFYDRVMRTVYYSVRQYNPAGKVFLSLTHAWAVTSKPTYFAPKYMLALFSDMSNKQGDYEWGVAFHPYSEDITNPVPWIDKDATMDINSTHIITPKNIELIDEWMRTPLHLYKGLKVRTLLFSEQGANSKSNSEQDMKQQAAVIAYMWKKCTRLPSVEAFDYHAQCDNRNEKLNFGLWTAKQGTIATPDQKKTSWYVYEKAGTSLEDSAFAFALPIIGVHDWSQVYNKLSGDIMPYTVTFNITKNGSALNDALIFFNGEMHKTVNGKAVFYNVASVQKNRNVRVMRNGQLLASQQNILINKDQIISIKIGQ